MDQYDKHIPDEELAIHVRELEEKVAQLKQFQRSLHPTELSDYTKTYYVFNSSEIDKAVRVWGNFDLSPGPEAPAIEAVLMHLNIIRCDGCNGVGHDKRFGAGRFDLSCPTCKGHGWVIRDNS